MWNTSLFCSIRLNEAFAASSRSATGDYVSKCIFPLQRKVFFANLFARCRICTPRGPTVESFSLVYPGATPCNASSGFHPNISSSPADMHADHVYIAVGSEQTAVVSLRG